MKRFETVVGYTGSEVERAALATNIQPVETRLEALVKREVAKVLARVAKSIDHTVFAPQAVQH